jgi:SWI/SNF related-matrix-associated actin-dependent regulator of chromatin subfamily C
MTEEVPVVRRKKSGYPNNESFHDPQYIHSFSKISRALIDLGGLSNRLNLDERSLSEVSFQIQTFMESNLGKSSNLSNRVMTKIPTSSFRDYSIDGSLMNILLVALKFQLKVGWKIFDLVPQERSLDGLEIIRIASLTLLEVIAIMNVLNCMPFAIVNKFTFILRSHSSLIIVKTAILHSFLVKNRMLRRPEVYIGKVPGYIIADLKRIVTQNGGLVTDSINEASHVVDWDEEVDSLPSELSEEFIRTLEVRPSEVGGTALVHWFYHPDSYDEWIPSDHVDGSEPPDTVPQENGMNKNRKWHVCCRFIMDCEIFNEWGNEIDYESIPEGEDDNEDSNEDGNNASSPVKSGAGRKVRGRRRSDANKPKKVPILESVVIAEKMMLDFPPPLNDPTIENVVVIDILMGNECQVSIISPQEKKVDDQSNTLEIPSTQIETPVVVNEGSKRKSDMIDDHPIETSASSNSIKLKIEKGSGRKGSSQSHLKLPAWYSSEGVNALEIKYLPSLFSRGIDPGESVGEYVKMRNFMVSLYAHNPSIYLSATDCRRKLSGDVCMVLKVHDFLDAFGVINFNVKLDYRPSATQASLSHWQTDSNNICSSHNPPSSGSSVPSITYPVDDNDDLEWSGRMDLSLQRYTLASPGNWEVVAAAMQGECDKWKMTPQECLTRFVSLPLKVPALSGSFLESSENFVLPNIASGNATQQLSFLSSQIAENVLSDNLRTAFQKLVSDASSYPLIDVRN